jgi:hypothetical protein
MSAPMIGSLVGLAFGLLDFGALTFVASRNGVTDQARSALHMVRYVGVVFFPIVGWFAGPLFVGE